MVRQVLKNFPLHTVTVAVVSAPAAVFFFCWLIYGSLINSTDLRAYTLQHAGVEALGKHRTIEIGLSTAHRLQKPGDSFVFEGRRYAAKQPGQFFFGVPGYLAAAALGFDYQRSYDDTAAFVVWLSSSLFTALTAALVFLLNVKLWQTAAKTAAGLAFTFAFATPFLAYVSVPHHDVIASFFLTAGFYAIERAKADAGRPCTRLFFFAGLFLSLTLFCSMLPAAAVLVLFCYALLSASHRRLFFLGGFLTGLLPLSLYNYSLFGTPWTQANIAGNYSDTFFSPNLTLFFHHLNFYLGTGPTSVWRFAPVFPLSIVLLFALPRRLRAEQWVLGSMLAAHLLFVCQISTIGGSQFGPRYLLPLYPLLIASLGPAVSRFEKASLRLLVALLCLLACYSFTVNFTGAIFGTMWSPGSFPFPAAWAAWPEQPSIRYPLQRWSFALLLVYCAAFYRHLSWRPFRPAVHLKHLWKISGSWAVPASLAAGCVYFFLTPRSDSGHNYTLRIAGALLNGQLGLTAAPPRHLNEMIPLDGLYYSVFPLGAVLSVLPFKLLAEVTALQFFAWSSFITAFLCALMFYFTCALSKSVSKTTTSSLLYAVVLTFGTWQLANLLFGSAWCLALAFCIMGQLGALYFIFVRRLPLLAGFFFAVAFGNRTEIILAAPLLFYLIERQSSESLTFKQLFADAARFAYFPMVLLLLTFAYNYARFGSLFDFGYTRIPNLLLEPYYQDGLFALSAITRNIYAMLIQGWKQIRTFPYMTPTGFGGSIFLACPFLFTLFRRTNSNRDVVVLSWVAIAVLTLVLWCHGNPGGWQFSYRYATELLPWALLVMLNTSPPSATRIDYLLAGLSVTINGYAAYLMDWTRYVRP